jgi:hypothetical protein
MKRLNEAGAEHVSCAEEKFEEIVFGLAFDAGPHDAAVFGGVSASAGDVEEGHGGVELRQRRGCGEGEVVGEVLVLLFGHSGGGDAEGEEAGVEAGELGLDGGVVEEVGVDELPEFGVVLTGWCADDGEDLVNVGVEQALAKNALAYHAGCSEEDYVHGLMLQPWGRDAPGQEGNPLFRQMRDEEIGHDVAGFDRFGELGVVPEGMRKRVEDNKPRIDTSTKIRAMQICRTA